MWEEQQKPSNVMNETPDEGAAIQKRSQELMESLQLTLGLKPV